MELNHESGVTSEGNFYEVGQWDHNSPDAPEVVAASVSGFSIDVAYDHSVTPPERRYLVGFYEGEIHIAAPVALTPSQARDFITGMQRVLDYGEGL